MGKAHESKLQKEHAMELNVSKRLTVKKGDVKMIRRVGDIPAILYQKGEENIQLTIKGEEFQSFLRGVEKGHLPTTVFKIKLGKKTYSAIVKEIQYHRVTYDVLHLDFQELTKDLMVCVNVPVHCVGAASCVGIAPGTYKLDENNIAVLISEDGVLISENGLLTFENGLLISENGFGKSHSANL